MINNSRFSVLIENKNKYPKNKELKENYKKNKELKENYKKNKESKEDNKQNKELKENYKKNKELKESNTNANSIIIQEHNFPEFTTNKSTINKNVSTLSYLNKLQIIKLTTEDTDILKPGWIKFEKNKLTKEVKITHGKQSYISDEEREITPEEVIDNLVYLHEKRKYDYIKLWGEEDYNKTFRFLNYDYDYFDNLDMKYEIEMDKLNEEYENNEEI